MIGTRGNHTNNLNLPFYTTSCLRHRNTTTNQHVNQRPGGKPQNTRNFPKPNRKFRPAGQNIATEGEKDNTLLPTLQTTNLQGDLAYHSMYTKSLQIPLGVTMMTYNMANNISKQTMRAVIGAMHVNRSLPRILAFTGTKLLGLGLQHHYCAQGISHVKQVIQHTRQQDEKGKMYQIILECGQLLARVQFPILQHLKPKLPHIMDLLITTICQFLANSQLNIAIPQLYIPRPLCENDLDIMGEILKIE
jgi:hypothetical protein